jgi:putative ABC transport system ATP-binding protein
MKVYRLENVYKVYKTKAMEYVALRDVNLEIEKGDFIALVGPSGSGKSTLLYILGLLESATSGKIYLLDREISKLNEREKSRIRNRTIGFVFQSYNLVNHLSVYENIELPLIIAEIPKHERERMIEKVLEIIPGIRELVKKRPNQLSMGQQQRVAIARALVINPEIVLADEPTANLDTATGNSIVKLIRELNEELKITVIMATHDPEMLKYAKGIVRIRDGKIELQK